MTAAGAGGDLYAGLVAAGVVPERSQAEIAMLADFRHPMLKGPLGGVVARTIKGDLDSSMKRLAAIVG